MASLEGLTLDKDGCFTDRPEAIATWSGGRMAPTKPEVEDIKITDIARGLANACRWNGQCSYYSVAEHSVLVSYMLPPHLALDGLMHDAAEAYLTDMARPVKTHSLLGTLYLQYEEELERAIAERFKLSWPWHDKIKEADYAMGFAEAKELVPHLGALMPPVEVVTPALKRWTPDEAYSQFLVRYLKLGGRA